MRCIVPSDFIPELCCSPRQPQRGHKLISHTFLIVLPLLQSGVVTDTDGQEERASDGISRVCESMYLGEEGLRKRVKDRKMSRYRMTYRQINKQTDNNDSLPPPLPPLLQSYSHTSETKEERNKQTDE